MFTREITRERIEIINNGVKRTAFKSNYTGLSTDVKPTDAENADTLYEMDTQKVYMFNASNSTWVEQ